MRSSKYAALLALAAVMVLATAATAFAQPGSSGPVYGQATMQPVLSISVAAGSEGTLYYWGQPNDTVYTGAFANPSDITVTNTGDASTKLYLGWGSNPNVNGGSDAWEYGAISNIHTCVWKIGGVSVPSEGNVQVQLSTSLAKGDSKEFGTSFTFPNTYSGSSAAHSMSAIISAESPVP